MARIRKMNDLPYRTKKFLHHLGRQRTNGYIISTSIKNKFGIHASTTTSSSEIYLHLDSRKKIKEGYIIAAVAHEYGHILSYREGRGKARCLTRKDQIYWAFGLEISAKGKKCVYFEEKEAWRRAETTLKRYGYKEWALFNELKSWALRSYRKLLWHIA